MSNGSGKDRERQAMLGCAPAHVMLDFSKGTNPSAKAVGGITRVSETSPRSFRDYKVGLHKDRLPKGVDLLELV